MEKIINWILKKQIFFLSGIVILSILIVIASLQGYEVEIGPLNIGGKSNVTESNHSQTPSSTPTTDDSTTNTKSVTDCSQEICIITPVNNAEVERAPLIKVKVATANVSNLLVLIQPLSGKYCSESQAQRITNSDWVVQAFLGNPRPEDVGKYFSIQAIGNPARPPLQLLENIGSCDVEAEFKSNVIVVKRR